MEKKEDKGYKKLLVLFSFCFFCFLLLSACSSTKDVSEKNLEQAVNAYLDTQPPCFSQVIFSDWSFIDNDYFGFSVTIAIAREKRNHHSRLGRFVDIGLLTVEKTKLEERDGLGRLTGRLISGKKYDLTELGKKYHSFDQFGKGQFCYGKWVVKEITNYTLPTEGKGPSEVTVQYTFVAEDIAKWAMDPYFENVVNEALDSQKKPISGSARLVLTKKGWVHLSLAM